MSATKKGNLTTGTWGKAMTGEESAKILLRVASVSVSDNDKALVAACRQLADKGLADHLQATERPIKFLERFKANRRTQEALK